MSDTKSLHAALIEARKAIPAIPKTAKNPHFGNSYAPLGTILEAVLPALHAQGLSLSSAVSEGALVVAIVSAETGETVESRVPLLGATDMQKLGGAMTYALRYAVGSLLALELEDDDDGNRASVPSRTTSPAKAPSGPQGTVSPLGTSPTKGACPKCGKKEFIKQLKTGKDAGRFRCMDWEEKKMYGCGATFNSDPRVLKQADDFLAPVRQPAQQTVPPEGGSENRPFPEAPGPGYSGDDDLPF
jgi:hypothetical protein